MGANVLVSNFYVYDEIDSREFGQQLYYIFSMEFAINIEIMCGHFACAGFDELSDKAERATKPTSTEITPPKVDSSEWTCPPNWLNRKSFETRT